MFNRNILGILLILFIFMLSLGCVSAQDNSTSDFDSVAELPSQVAEDDLGVGESKSFDEIQEQVDNANDNDVIHIEGYYDDGYSININKPITIDGDNNTTLVGNKTTGVFCFYADNCTLRNLKIIDATYSAVSVYANNFLIENCEFINNNARMYSNVGALMITADNVTVKNCTFKNCENPVDMSGRNLTVMDSYFSDNTGSCIYISGLNELIENCEFINNDNAITYVGFERYYMEVLVSDGTERFIVRNSIFTNHKDGAIKYSQSSEIKNNVMVNNAIIDNCTFTGNSASSDGGAVEFSPQGHAKIEISNSRFKNNKAGYNGGAARLLGNGNRISNCNFTDNSAKELGGALYLYGDNQIVENSNFINSRAYYHEIYYSDFGGGAIYCHGLSLSVSNALFENSLASKGGAILADGGMLTVDNSRFINNHAKKYGAILCKSINANACEFVKNTAEICSAVAVDNQATITNSKFTDNTSPFATLQLLGKYNLNNNVYSGNRYGLLIAGKAYEGHAYDENLKRIELITFKASNLKVEYGSNKHFTVKLTHKYTGKPIGYAVIYVLDAKTGKKLDGGVTNAKGICKFDSLKAGTYNVKVIINTKSFATWRSDLAFSHNYSPDPLVVKLVINKASTKVKAPKIVAKHKKSKNFKITVNHGKNPVKKVKINVKIGKKVYKVKTNSKGVAKINTKKLKVGKYKVVISSGNVNYKISAKSKITIKR